MSKVYSLRYEGEEDLESLLTRNGQRGLCLPHYLDTSLGSPSRILRSFPVLGF